MASLLIRNARLYDAAETDGPCAVLVSDGTIEQIGDLSASVRADRVLDAGGRILAPGLIDVHIQGAGGADALDATPEALEAISKTCARFGVTGFLATTVYMPGQENRHLTVAADCVNRDLGGARLLGIHLESPFISPEKRGMIQPTCITSPSPAILEEIYRLTDETLKMMVIAPELPGNLDIIRALTDRGTVACLGHSAATYDDARRGFEAGISHITHLFNAMPSLHHRAPGPLGAIFETDNITCQVITDGVHIHPSVVRLAYGTLGPDRFVTITDGMQALGLPDGKYVYNGIEYEARDGAARYEDGTLIGTALGLNRMLARLTDFTGCSRIEAVNTVTRNAAGVLGLQDTKGTIETGKDADLVLLNEDWSVHATIVGGVVVYQDQGN
ncbi:MAG: N-acetylglucosamine-6-phosphate deacetylase [Sedimentisphaerales bacterium]|nr:N-acetylglucosamine-6-phosphate deacetylase [Sedimentisphaerales bacterium]